MPKILFDKKRKKRIIHIAGHAKRQRLRKNMLFLKCLHLNCDSQLYILSHPSIHKNPLPGGFLCLLGIFLFVRDDRTAGSFPKQVSGGWDPTAVRQLGGGWNALQRQRPPPVADTGSCCWGRGQQDASNAQRMLGAATRIRVRRADA